jgi:hypothetical protein
MERSDADIRPPLESLSVAYIRNFANLVGRIYRFNRYRL